MESKIQELIKAAQEKVAANEIQEAIALYKEVTELDPKHEEAFFQIGTLYYQLGQFGPALSGFYAVIDINPDNKKAQVNLDMINSIMDYHNKDLINP
ncbi:MAG: tetratricopeptide repeat protein [Marinifilaceae bacterium]|jgi:tetratricopeptide (TPR) repeat protein